MNQWGVRNTERDKDTGREHNRYNRYTHTYGFHYRWLTCQKYDSNNNKQIKQQTFWLRHTRVTTAQMAGVYFHELRCDRATGHRPLKTCYTCDVLNVMRICKPRKPDSPCYSTSPLHRNFPISSFHTYLCIGVCMRVWYRGVWVIDTDVAESCNHHKFNQLWAIGWRQKCQTLY